MQVSLQKYKLGKAWEKREAGIWEMFSHIKQKSQDEILDVCEEQQARVTAGD